MATQLGQYKGALRAIGDQRLNSLSENTLERYTLDDVWVTSQKYLLLQHPWKFALRVVRLTPDPGITTVFGPKYAYTKPTDYVRMDGFSTDPYFQNQIRIYDEHDGAWFTDEGNPVYLRYVSNDANHGGNLANWPVLFELAHQYYLAEVSGLQITKSGQTKDMLTQDYIRALNRAKVLDSNGKAPESKPMGTWTRARLSRTTSDGGTNQPW